MTCQSSPYIHKFIYFCIILQGISHVFLIIYNTCATRTSTRPRSAACASCPTGRPSFYCHWVPPPRNCGLIIDCDVKAAINILAEALFCELKIRFNTDVARRKFTPADLVALATSLSGCGETTEETPQLCGTDAQCILTVDGRAALVDEFFNRLRNHVANATVNCYV